MNQATADRFPTEEEKREGILPGDLQCNCWGKGDYLLFMLP